MYTFQDLKAKLYNYTKKKPFGSCHWCFGGQSYHRTRKLVQSVLNQGFQWKRTRKYFGNLNFLTDVNTILKLYLKCGKFTANAFAFHSNKKSVFLSSIPCLNAWTSQYSVERIFIDEIPGGIYYFVSKSFKWVSIRILIRIRIGVKCFMIIPIVLNACCKYIRNISMGNVNTVIPL